MKASIKSVAGLAACVALCAAAHAGTPTGCPDFDVELPRATGGAVIRAADFGFSETNDHNAAAINAALAEARRVRASRLELAPGTYRCFEDGALGERALPSGVVIDGFEDFTFDGKGATLVFRRDHAPLATQAELLENEGNVEVRNCVRTVVENFNIDWDWENDPLAVWCTCAAKHVDEADNASYIDFDLEKPHPKYPNPVPVQLLTPMAADKSGARMTGNRGVRAYFGMSLGHIGAKSEWISPTRLRMWPYVRPAKGYVTDESLNRYKAKNNRSLVKAIDIGGTYVISHCYYGLNGIVLTSNRHFTLRNVDIWACRGLGVETRGAQKWWQLVNVNVRPKPGCRYPVTSTADAHHVVQSQGFGKMVGCEVTMNQDDHFNYHDRTQIAQTRGPRTVEVVNNRGVAYTLFHVGTLIALRHEDFSDAGWTGRIVKIDGERITFDRDLPPQKGMLFVLLDKGYATENFLFKDCWFHDSPWHRGIVQGNNVTIDGCRFGPMIGTPLKFISCYTYTCWCEGIGCSNVVVRNCRFENCLSSRYENNPQIIVSMQTPPEHWPQRHERITHAAFAREVEAMVAAGRTVKPCRDAVCDILVERNTFVNPPGLLLTSENASRITFRDNAVEWREPVFRRLPCAGQVRMQE